MDGTQRNTTNKSNSHLVDVASGVVEDPEHGHETVGRPVGTGHVRVGGPDAMDRDPNATRELRDGRALHTR